VAVAVVDAEVVAALVVRVTVAAGPASGKHARALVTCYDHG
jgi:hypothetical protein